MPPLVDVVEDPIDPASLLADAGGDEDGAVLLFLGTVRDHADGRPVTGMRYDAYRDMAVAVLRDIAGEAAELAGNDRVAVVHRVGELAIGDVSVAVLVSSAHRDAAYRASRHVIEEIKKRLPVWKKEFYADGPAAWVEGVDPSAHLRGSSAGAAAGTSGEGRGATR